MCQEKSSEAFVVGQAFRAQTGEVYRVPGEEGAAGLGPGGAWSQMVLRTWAPIRPGIPPEDPQARLHPVGKEVEEGTDGRGPSGSVPPLPLQEAPSSWSITQIS